jgi:hypothetical protein
MPDKLHAHQWRTERFEVIHVERPDDLPRHDSLTIDIALLDMHHGFANVGHDAIVALVRDATVASDAVLARARRRVRLISYSACATR